MCSKLQALDVPKTDRCEHCFHRSCSSACLWYFSTSMRTHLRSVFVHLQNCLSVVGFSSITSLGRSTYITNLHDMRLLLALNTLPICMTDLCPYFWRQESLEFPYQTYQSLNSGSTRAMTVAGMNNSVWWAANLQNLSSETVRGMLVPWLIGSFQFVIWTFCSPRYSPPM